MGQMQKQDAGICEDEVRSVAVKLRPYSPIFYPSSEFAAARHFPFPYSFLVLFSARWYLPFCFSQASSLSISTKSDPKQAKIANRMTSSSSFRLFPGIWAFSRPILTHFRAGRSGRREEGGKSLGSGRLPQRICYHSNFARKPPGETSCFNYLVECEADAECMRTRRKVERRNRWDAAAASQPKGEKKRELLLSRFASASASEHMWARPVFWPSLNLRARSSLLSSSSPWGISPFFFFFFPTPSSFFCPFLAWLDPPTRAENRVLLNALHYLCISRSLPPVSFLISTRLTWLLASIRNSLISIFIVFESVLPSVRGSSWRREKEWGMWKEKWEEKQWMLMWLGVYGLLRWVDVQFMTAWTASWKNIGCTHLSALLLENSISTC